MIEDAWGDFAVNEEPEKEECKYCNGTGLINNTNCCWYCLLK